MTRREQRPAVRRLSKWALIAAVLALLLTGAAAADVVNIILPGSMQEWLGQRWTDQGGSLMNGEEEVIREHVQTVGVSDTQEGVTITLDSVTAAENYLRVFLKIQGEDLDEDLRLGELELLGLPLFMQGGYSVSKGDTLEDGTLVRLATFQYTLEEGTAFSGGGDMALHVKGLEVWRENALVTAADGDWILPFTLEPLAEQETLTVERAEAPREKGWGLMEIWDIRVTATGFSFLSWEGLTAEVSLCLSDGMEVRAGETGSFGTEGESQTVQGVWSVPVDLSMAEALRFGDVVVPLS